MTRAEHGTRSCYQRGCDRPECAEAARAYDRLRKRQQRRPDEALASAFVPAGPVRRHLLDLVAAGLSLRSIADTIGVSHVALVKLSDGRTKKVRRTLRSALLAVRSGNYVDVISRDAYDDYEELLHALAQVVEDRRAAWRARAACRHPGITVDVFFVGRGEAPELARRVCDTCLVIDDCARYAEAHHEQVGFWAGQAPKERRPGQRDREDVA